MKKFVMLAIIICSAFNIVNAQDKQFESVSNAFLLTQVEKAKIEIDKIMKDPKAQAKAEGWLWKTRVYAELYYSDDFRAKYPGVGLTAYEAFKKYESLDQDYKMLAEAAAYRPMDLIYVAGFNQGRKFFDSKQWDSSYIYFTAAAHMGEIITKKDLRKTGAKIDTLTVVYTGYAAQNAKKEEEAIIYYKKMADLRIGGKEYVDCYSYILVHYANKKDPTNFNKYLAISKEVYPSGDWEDYEVDFLNKTYTLAEKSSLYDKEDAAGTLTARKYLLYGQIFSEIPKEEKAALDSAKKVYYEKKSADAYMKAYGKDNTMGIAAFNAGVMFYNEYGNLDDKYRNNIRSMQELNSNKPVEKDPKKKATTEAKFKTQIDVFKKANAEIEKPMLETVDKAIEWLEKSFVTLNATTTKDKTIKNCLNKSVDWLTNLYTYKREKVKGKDQKAYDAYEAKVKQYDALHGKM